MEATYEETTQRIAEQKREAFWVPGGSDSKESTYSVGDLGLSPGLERSPGGGHANPLQESCLENPMDRRAWRATVHEVAKSGTGVSNQHTHVLRKPFIAY